MSTSEDAGGGARISSGGGRQIALPDWGRIYQNDAGEWWKRGKLSDIRVEGPDDASYVHAGGHYQCVACRRGQQHSERHHEAMLRLYGHRRFDAPDPTVDDQHRYGRRRGR